MIDEDDPGAAEDDRLHRVEADKLIALFEDVEDDAADERETGERGGDIRRQTGRARVHARPRERGGGGVGGTGSTGSGMVLFRGIRSRIVKRSRGCGGDYRGSVCGSVASAARASERRRAVTAIRVDAGPSSYRVLVGSGLLRTLGSETAALLRGPRCAVIADETTARLFGEEVVASLAAGGFTVHSITVAAGERAKSLTQVGEICDRLTAAGLDRSSFIVALGGGVVGDLAGFVAAIYHRGIPYVQVPTTLLAQVDSSVGGKTGVNTAAGKNLLGAVHQPALVVADVNVLKTLPPREFHQGFAEIIKHGVIFDPSLFDALENFERADLATLVRRNVEIKAAVVAQDEHDRSGTRAVLNFGHTVGHAIERAGEYGRFLHGEAISLGIAAACEVSVRKAGLPESDRKRVLAALQKFQLPTKLPPDFPREAILPAIGADKKFERGEVRFVVTPRLGSAHLASDVTMEEIRAAIGAL